MRRNPFYFKQIINDYFTFSKGQRRAVVLLLFAIGLSIVLPAFYYYFFVPVTGVADDVTLEQIASLRAAEDSGRTAYRERRNTGYGNEGYSSTNDGEPENFSLFVFDPNTASFAQWQQLGIRDKTIRTIHNYLSKGGHFYKPEDLRKIYGLRPAEVARLLPYVSIGQPKHPVASADKHGEKFTPEKRTNVALTPIDINAADTSAFIKLPGIGSKLAARIVNFRDKLGGFYAIEQVGETFGVADSVFQKIKPLLRVNPSAVKQRNLNTFRPDELKHPYMPFNVVHAIIRYRENNGPFTAVEDLRKIPLIDEPLYLKISPYLAVE